MSKRVRPKQRHHPFAPYRINDVPLFLEQAIEHHRRGKVDEAFAIYRRILATVPNHADALHFMGLAEYQKGHAEKALELMSQSIALVPGHADFLSNRGNIYRHLHNLAAAEADYLAALEISPTHGDALNNLGVVLRERGDLLGALARFREAIAHHPTHADAYQNLGNALASELRFEEALEAHRTALKLNPKNARAFRHVAGMCYATGRLAEATALYRAWLDAFPEDPVAQHMLAACTENNVPARASNDYVRTTFDDYADSFERSLARLEYRAPQLVGDLLKSELGPGPKTNFTLLDAGCGTGLAAPHLRPWATRLIGVDLSPKMLERAKARNLYDELIEAELAAYLSSQEGTLDAAISADTLVYFGELSPLLQAFKRALKPNGLLIFTVERENPEVAPNGFRIHPHGRYSHSPQYVETALTDAGLVQPSLRQTTLRKEAGNWVNGLLVSARKPVT